jgi:nucleoside 2-deoxyribosyltransferase
MVYSLIPMKIMIVGSMCFAKEMVETKKLLETLAHQVALPCDTDDHLKDPTLRDDPERDRKHSIEKDVYQKCFEILASNDAILALNKEQRGIEGYIGAATLMEIGLAYYLKKRIFLLNPVSSKERYAEDITILGVTILRGDLTKIPTDFVEI